jgi:hypothetical protein
VRLGNLYSKLVLEDLISLYEKTPDTLEQSMLMKSKTVVDQLCANHEEFLRVVYQTHAKTPAKEIPNANIFAFLDDLFHRELVEIRAGSQHERTPKNEYLRTVHGTKTIQGLITAFLEENKSEKQAIDYHAAMNLLYFMAENTTDFEFILHEDKKFSPRHATDEDEHERGGAHTEESEVVDDLRKEMLRTIQAYEERLKKCKTAEERRIVQNMLNTLQLQLNEIDRNHANETPSMVKELGNERQRSYPQGEPVHGHEGVGNTTTLSDIQNHRMRKTVLSKDERRERVLQEIFRFYATEQLMIGRHSTFDHIKSTMELWNVGKLFIFLKDFQAFNDFLTRRVSPAYFHGIYS